jgi:phosphotransferase system HPr (HPr) family protein
MMEKTVIVKNEAGLDPGRIAVMVQTACKFESSVHLKKDDRKVNAKSIMGMMNMAVPKGGEVTIIAEGPDEEAAIAEMEKEF